MASKREVTVLIKAVDRASRVLRSVGNSAQKNLKQVGDAAQDAARSIGLIGAALSLALGIAINTTADFQQSMANTQSVIGATTEELMTLTEAAREFGKVTVFRASEAADAMFFLASAGLKTEQVISALPGTLALAAATNTDLAMTTERVVANMAAFGLQAREASRVANVFAATIGNSQATMERLGLALSFVGPVANSVNLSIEETSAILGRLFTSGIAASTAGTALRMAIAQLLKPSEDAKAIMEKLGLTVLNSADNLRNFIDIIEDLERSGLSAKDAMTLFGVRAGPALLALVNQGSDALRGLVKTVTGTNKAAEMAALQIGTFKGQLRLLKSAAQELQIVIGTELLPVLTTLVQKMTAIVLKTADWAKEHKALTKILGTSTLTIAGLAISLSTLGFLIFGITKAVKPLISAATWLIGKFLALVSMVKLATFGVKGFGIAVTFAGSVIGGVLATLGLFAGLFKLINRETDKMEKKVDAFGARRGAKDIEDIKAALETYETALAQVREAQNKGAESVSLLGTAIADNGIGLSKWDARIRPVNDVILTLRKRVDLLKEQLFLASGGVRDYRNSMETASPIIKALFDPLKALGEWLKKVADATKLTTEEFNKLRGEMEFLKLDTTPAIERFKALSAAVDQFGEAVGNVKTRINDLMSALPDDTGARRILFFPETQDELQARIRIVERAKRELAKAPAETDFGFLIPIKRIDEQEQRLKASIERIGEFRAEIDEEMKGRQQTNLDRFLRFIGIREEATAAEAEKLRELNLKELEANQQLADSINSIRESSFQQEQNRIRQLQGSYTNFIRTAINIGRQFFSEQEAGWIRALAALVRFISRAIAGFLRERALEKLKQAEQAKTASQFFIQHGAKMISLAAEFALMGDLVRAALALAAAGKDAAQAVAFQAQATILQTEAAGLMTASVAVEAAGVAVAGGIDLAADAAQRAARAETEQARATERRLQTELDLKIKILELEGRTFEARRLGLEAEAFQLREMGIDENLIRRFQQLSLGQGPGDTTPVDTSFTPAFAGAGGGTTVFQTNTFNGILELNNETTLAELAQKLSPFLDDVKDTETEP